MRETFFFIWLATAVVLCVSTGAAAQTVPTFEISGGYQLLHLGDEADETMPRGWYADVVGNTGRHVGVVFHVGGNYKTLTKTETFGGFTSSVEADFHVHEFMGGIRFNARSDVVTPFAQILVGGVSASANVEGSVTGLGETFFAISEGESSTELGVMTGGGVNFNLTDHLGLRVGVDYLRVFAEDEDGNAFRLGVGVVFPF